jgi:phosphotriesterase-related protein
MSLLNGITYAHEHITIDLSGPKKNLDCKLDAYDETIKELKELKSKGVYNIIDVTNRGMGRNINYLTKVKEETGINILASTGYYKSPFFPEEVYKLSLKQLEHIMLMEITDGIDNSGVKAEIIGEIGTSKDIILPEEEKVFRAASMVHVETGKPIVTHTTLGTLGLEQIKIFKEYGVNLDKVVISHVDLSGDLDYILRLIDKGVNVAFDTIGKINYKPEDVRVNLLKELSKRGLSEKIVLSMDITRKSHLKYLKGLGYSYLLDTFVPLLRKSDINESDIDNMLKNNAQRIYG